MFHANAWGMPFTAAVSGARQVMPGPHLDRRKSRRAVRAGASDDGGRRADDLARHSSVPRCESRREHDLTPLRRMLVGGAAVPEPLIRAFQDRHGLAHPAGLGHDRDESRRIGQQGDERPRRRAERRPVRVSREGGDCRCRSSRFARAATTASSPRGTARRWASSRSVGRGSRAAYYDVAGVRRSIHRRRLVPHRRHRVDRCARLHNDSGSVEGSREVGRRMDQQRRARGRAALAPGRRRRPSSSRCRTRNGMSVLWR